MLTSQILDGKALADHLLGEHQDRIRSQGLDPSLHVILVGDDEASLSYIRHKTKKAEQIGIRSQVHDFSEATSQKTVIERIQSLNHDETASGIIVQLPLPDRFDEEQLLEAVDPRKDVDGLHPLNFGKLLGGGTPFFYPPTPKGILRLLSEYDIDLTGRVTVLVGMGRLVGRPLSQMLLNRDATVLCLNETTPSLKPFTTQADILVVGAGVPHLIGREHVAKGSVVIDAGIHRVDGELVGDVKFEDVSERADFITPVPGGVGPLTVAGLLGNTCEAAHRLNHHQCVEILFFPLPR